MSLYSASNGTSPTRGCSRRVSSTSRPPFAASTTSAPSVGSPMHAPSRITASFASAIGSMNGSSDWSSTPRRAADAQDAAGRRVALAVDAVATARRRTSWRAVIWLSVSVPVLSEQIADVEPSVSTDRSRLTIAPFAASACVPDRQQHRDDGGQARRDRGDGEADADQEQVVEVVAAGEADAG